MKFVKKIDFLCKIFIKIPFFFSWSETKRKNGIENSNHRKRSKIINNSFNEPADFNSLLQIPKKDILDILNKSGMSKKDKENLTFLAFQSQFNTSRVSFFSYFYDEKMSKNARKFIDFDDFGGRKILNENVQEFLAVEFLYEISVKENLFERNKGEKIVS